MNTFLIMLTAAGQFILKFVPPEYVSKLQATLPAWAIGLLVIVVLAFVLKVVTSIVFKIILWITVIVLVVILLESFNVPVLQTVTSLGS